MLWLILIILTCVSRAVSVSPASPSCLAYHCRPPTSFRVALTFQPRPEKQGGPKLVLPTLIWHLDLPPRPLCAFTLATLHARTPSRIAVANADGHERPSVSSGVDCA